MTVSNDSLAASRLLSLNLEGNENRPPSASPLEARVRAAEERIARITNAEDLKFQMMTEQASRIAESIHADKMGVDVSGDRLFQNIKSAEQNFLNEIENLKRSRVEAEKFLEQSAIQKAINMTLELKRDQPGKATAAGSQSVSSGLKTLGEELLKMHRETDKLRYTRIDKCEQIGSAINSEIEKLGAAVDAEKRVRIQQQNQILKMMEEMCMRLQTEIDEERMERQVTQEHLLNLLEETCARVEVNFIRQP